MLGENSTRKVSIRSCNSIVGIGFNDFGSQIVSTVLLFHRYYSSECHEEGRKEGSWLIMIVAVELLLTIVIPLCEKKREQIWRCSKCFLFPSCWITFHNGPFKSVWRKLLRWLALNRKIPRGPKSHDVWRQQGGWKNRKEASLIEVPPMPHAALASFFKFWVRVRVRYREAKLGEFSSLIAYSWPCLCGTQLIW